LKENYQEKPIVKALCVGFLYTLGLVIRQALVIGQLDRVGVVKTSLVNTGWFLPPNKSQ
jgi:hypothetical protein